LLDNTYDISRIGFVLEAIVDRDFPDGLRPTTTVGLLDDSTPDRVMSKHFICSTAR